MMPSAWTYKLLQHTHTHLSDNFAVDLWNTMQCHFWLFFFFVQPTLPSGYVILVGGSWLDYQENLWSSWLKIPVFCYKHSCSAYLTISLTWLPNKNSYIIKLLMKKPQKVIFSFFCCFTWPSSSTSPPPFFVSPPPSFSLFLSSSEKKPVIMS